MLPKSGLQCEMLQDNLCPENAAQTLCHRPQMQDSLCLLVNAPQKLQVQISVLTVSLCM